MTEAGHFSDSINRESGLFTRSESKIVPAVGQHAIFMLAGHFLCVDILHVQEILRQQKLTRVPLARPTVAGLINLRGQIVPALDLRRVLGMPPREDEDSGVSIVLRTEGGPVSLQVDEIDDVVDLQASTFEPPPPNLGAKLLRLIRGVHELDGRLVLVLDASRAVLIDGQENG